MSGGGSLGAVVGRLAHRGAGRTEADIQSDVRLLLLAEELNLDDTDLTDPKLETQAGAGRRIDVEVGATVIEVKKDLRAGSVREKAVVQLAGYVAHRSSELGVRYVGILTDGAEWALYHLDHETSALQLVSRFELSEQSPDVDGLRNWLDGVLATADHVTPTPAEIEGRLGARSSAHALDYADLAALYAAHRRVPSVRTKRELWARLLTTALGTNFVDDDDLFVEHTLLVVTAELIAHAVVGIDPTDPSISPSALLAGRRFSDASIGGVVEADFFDWVTEVPGGEIFVRTLARRLRRFAWERVEHDVMKVLYESVIAAEQRKRLGEYYTPDWLAEKIVDAVVDDPLEQRVLDPACGSGTFVFHAVRRVLNAADHHGLTNGEAIQRATELVIGVDIHPVAVTLARVTYLLAIGWDRLSDPDRPGFTVPVYLGDSLQWGQEETLFDTNDLVIRTNDGAELFANELRFPRALLADARKFDELIGELAERAAGSHQARTDKAIISVLRRFGVPDDLHKQLLQAFSVLSHLHQVGRDHIWGYYVRNLARPAWLTRLENRVDRIVGNPPWLAYRFMTPSMQTEFQAMTRERGLWSRNASVATHQDLSGLFVARSVQLYLREDGRFGFVMPNAVLTRRQYEGFRSGDYGGPVEPVRVAFSEAWDLEQIRPIFFPQSSCVIFGVRNRTSIPLSTTAQRWAGRLPGTNPSWSDAAPLLNSAATEGPTAHAASTVGGSPYAPVFSQGATFVPRVLLVVEDEQAGPLGVGHGRRSVRSRRTATEKSPWKEIPTRTGVIENAFVRRLHTGETLLPFRLAAPLLAVVPWDGTQLLDETSEDLGLYPGLERWWVDAATLWRVHRSSERLSLLEQVDYRGKLSNQFPAAEHRVVHAASGIHLVAAAINDPDIVIDKSLYWAPCRSIEEGRYLEAILNSQLIDDGVKPLQSRGKDSPRHIDKYVWQLPIPAFDDTNPGHRELCDLAELAAAEASGLRLRAGDFRRQRAQVRDHLAKVGLGARIDAAVKRAVQLPG